MAGRSRDDKLQRKRKREGKHEEREVRRAKAARHQKDKQPPVLDVTAASLVRREYLVVRKSGAAILSALKSAFPASLALKEADTAIVTPTRDERGVSKILLDAS